MTTTDTPPTTPNLTPTHLQIIQLMAEGHFHYQIALQLGLNPDEYARRRQLIYTRTGTRTPAQLTATAVREGWIN